MIKAGALLYSMFLVIVIAIVSSSFVLVNYYNNSYVIRILKQEELFRDVNSTINYGLIFHRDIPSNVLTVLDLFDDEQHITSLTKKNWGAFYILSAEAQWKNKSVKKSVLTGVNINEGEKVALYLADQNKPLSLTGNTKIVGNCYLPKAGVKRAYIEGKSFTGDKLIDGLKFYSEITLPPINEDIINENQKNFSYLISDDDSIVDYELVRDKDSIVNSFTSKTLIFYSPFSMVLANKVIDGNIIFKSEGQITVRSNTFITSAILYAKGIVLEDNVTSSVQLFAQDSILIGEKCKLTYPSVIALLGKGNTTVSRKIIIAENVEITGAIFLYNENLDRQKQSLVSIGEKCKITGQIYSSELLELKGEVIGGVFCQKVFLKTPSSIYENHLMDVVINREELSEHFVGAALTKELSHQRIIKWLN